MLAKEYTAKAFVGQKARSGPFDAQAFDFLPAFTLELLGGKRGVARQIGDQFKQASGKLRKPRDRNGRGVGASAGAQIAAHAAQVLFNLAAGTRSGPGAHYSRSHIREAGRGAGHERVAAPEK